LTPTTPDSTSSALTATRPFIPRRIGLHWRVLGIREHGDGEDTIFWYWIGSHAEYDRMIAAG
jgi:hypothetical protein